MESQIGMDGNTLIYWMSHLGEGSWQAFSRAVIQLEGLTDQADEDLSRKLVQSTRFRLSEIGSVDFVPEKNRRWQVLPPVLALFPEQPDTAVLCGGRSPRLVSQVHQLAAEHGCEVRSKDGPGLPDHIAISGPADALEAISSATSVRLSTNFAEELIESFVTIEQHLAKAPLQELMMGWARRYFDLATCRWTTELLPRTVCECTSRYGRTMTFLQISRTKTVLLPRREAIYGAAALSGVPIVTYNSDTSLLSVPMHAPLPDACARLACISSGNVGLLDGGSVSYGPISPRIAKIILASVGQRMS
jgi:hypothetical protein